MGLPIKAIDRIFERLSATYMAQWDRAMGATPQVDIKTAWAHELDAFGRSRSTMQCIAWALENLPESPPNAIQFKRLCQQAPAQDAPRIEMSAADPDRVKAELAKLASLRPSGHFAGASPDKTWAHVLKARHDCGERLNVNQIRCYRNALRMT